MVTSCSLKRTERSLSKNLEKLSTGLAINRSSDNAAGHSAAEQLRMQGQGLSMGNNNIQDGVSLLNVAEGALIEIENMLQRMRELTIQSSTATLNNTEREYIQLETSQLCKEIDRIAASTQFNKMTLLNGDTGNTANYNPWGSTEGAFLHIGPNSDMTSDGMRVILGTANCDGLFANDPLWTPGVGGVINVSDQTNAQAWIGGLDDAIDYVNRMRSNIGAYVNRLEHALSNQNNVLQNVTSAESLIRDADFSFETMNFTRLQILSQSSTAMLAQANSLPNNILNLLNQ
jgi:flagellin